jgi:hypothetical protein
MPTLEELLRVSLKGANERFDRANKALHAAVVEAAKAVEAVTDGKATLRLDEVRSDDDETRYDLNVVPKRGGEGRTLSNLAVTKKGFPIYRHQSSRDYTLLEQFDSTETLTAYFQKLASEPDSPLIGYLAYIVRNEERAIPF